MAMVSFSLVLFLAFVFVGKNGIAASTCAPHAETCANNNDKDLLMQRSLKLHMQDNPDCPTCVQGFQNAGGCEAWKDENWEKVHQAIPDGCHKCGSAAAQACSIKVEESKSLLEAFTRARSLAWQFCPDIPTCNQRFQNAGGCEAWKDENWDKVHQAIPDGCEACGREAAKACNMKVEESKSLLEAFTRERSRHAPCPETCTPSFMAAGGCEAWCEAYKTGNWDKMNQCIPDGCESADCYYEANDACFPKGSNHGCEN